MKLSKMTLREQMLVLFTALVLIGAAYGTFRFYPANKAISEIRKNTEMMDSATRTTPIPEEPFENVGDLKNDLALLEKELVDSRAMLAAIEQRLSPGDTTEVRLEISEVARKSGVLISINEEYRVMLPAPAAGGAGVAAAPAKRLGDAAQRRLRKARRASAANLGGGIAGIQNISPTQANALIRKLAVNGPMQRPMQRLAMEGTYAQIMRFIGGLEDMNKMATIVQLQLVPTPQAPPPGFPQRLNATMVLAL